MPKAGYMLTKNPPKILIYLQKPFTLVKLLIVLLILRKPWSFASFDGNLLAKENLSLVERANFSTLESTL